MGKIGGIIEQAINKILEKIRWPAAVLLFLMALLTTVDVIGRYVFSKPVSGNIDIQELMMVIIIFLAAGYCTLIGQHANADVVITRLPRRTRAIVDTVTWFLCAVTFGLISWQITKWGWSEMFTPTRATMLLAIKQGPFILIAAFGCITVCVASLVNFFRSLAQAKAKEEIKQ